MFDTVVGPNVRLRDNLIQLACIVVGAGAGALIGRMMMRNSDARAAMAIGAIIGLVAALLLSGAVIGVVRLILAARRR